METLPPVILGAVIFAAFSLVTTARRGIQDWFVLREMVVDQPRRQFLFEFALALTAGILSAVFNMIVHHFPVVTAFNLLSGVLVAGFFLSLDMALARERMVILEARANGRSEARFRQLSPMSRVFFLVAVSTAVCFAMVLVLVLIRDVGWLTNMGGAPEEVSRAEATVTYEILFIVAVLMGLVINIIYSYSRNLRLLFQSQTEILEKVSQGDFTNKVPVVTANEFGVIARHTNRMIEGLEHRISLLSALKVAEEVQKNLLPRKVPRIPGVVIGAVSQYSEETGGDYYDFIMQPGDGLVVVIGDISGHGVGAALLMSEARAILRMALERDTDLSGVTSDVNDLLSRDIGETGSFLTLFSIKIEPVNKRLTWVRGGHDPALLYDPVKGGFLELDGHGPALGISSEVRYQSQSRENWIPGSILVLATDGVWETHDRQGRMFGKDRLKEIVMENAAAHPQKIIEAVLASLASFRGNENQEDDVTLVVIKLE